MSSPQGAWDTPTKAPVAPQSAPQVSWDSEPSMQPAAPTAAPAPQESLFGELLDMGRLGSALVYSRLLGSDPHFAYDNNDEITKRLSAIAPDFASRVSKAATVKDDPLYMFMRKSGPESFESHDMLENFIHDVSEFIGDPVLYGPAILGAFGGPTGARIGTTGGFALDSGLRKALADHYQKGSAVSFGDLASRTGAAIWAATKGAITGEAMGYAGRIPAGSIPYLSQALRGLYQASAMETAGSILDWHAPSLESFTRNAVMVGGFGLIAHGVQLAIPDAKQGLLDVYAKDGTIPEQTAQKLQAQPPVKPEQPAGLKPAIRITAKDGSKQVISGEDATHADLAERVTGDKPVSLEQLEADPKLADKVLSQPEIHDQDVIDRAYAIKQSAPIPESTALAPSAPPDINIRNTALTKSRGGANRTVHVEFDTPDVVGLAEGDKEMLSRTIAERMFPDLAGDIEDSSIGKNVAFAKSAGEHHLQVEFKSGEAAQKAYASLRGPSGTAELRKSSDEPIPPKESLKSGRGFQTPSGDYLNRLQAKKWVKENEPEVYEMWKDSQGGDESATFHSQDYAEARKRVDTRTTLEGDPKLTGTPQELTQFLAKNRESLNEIKAGNKSEGYGKSVIRTLFTGPRNMVRAKSEQVAGHIEKLLPNYVDQEALSFMRDYRDVPDELRAEIEDIRKGDNEQLKRAIPSMERALEPTPAMLEADKQLTTYFTEANQLRSQFVGTTSAIDPERYSPRNFMRVEDEEVQSGGAKGGKFSKRSPHDIRREYLRMLDPLKSGDVQARTFNSVDGLRMYGDRLATSVARSALEMELKNSELGKHGIAGQVPPGLKALLGDSNILSQKELEELGGIPRNWVELPGTGKTVVTGGKQFRTGLQVPPKIAEAMRPILEGDVISGAKLFRVAKMTQAYIKAMELGLSPFHMRALSLSFLNNAGIDAYRNALISDNNSPEFEAQERKGALHGLTTTKTSTPYEAYQGLKPSSIEPRNTLLAKVKQGYAPIDNIFKGVTKATFEVAQRKFKVIDFSTKEAQWLAKNPNASDAEYGTAMRSIAKEVNAIYGGLNWEVMGVNASYQAWSRMFLLAPDWTFSNVATLKYAGEGGPGGAASRAFWLKSMITGYAMTQGMSLFLTGQMSKQPFAVYLGKDDKGKEMYSTIFHAGAPKDLTGLITKVSRDGFPGGAITFSINKAAPLFGTGARIMLNKDWQGRPITKRGDEFAAKSGKQLVFGAEQLLPAPFIIKDITERYMNPDEDLTYKDFLAAIAGAPVYHEGAKKESSGSGRAGRRYSLRGSRGSR